jgi:hypothetical protein
MSSDPADPALHILAAMNERLRRSETIDCFPEGIVALHADFSAKTSGEARAIEGNLLVEEALGPMRRISGEQIAALAELEPEFVRQFLR